MAKNTKTNDVNPNPILKGPKPKPWWELRSPDLLARNWDSVLEKWTEVDFKPSNPGSSPEYPLSELGTLTKPLAQVDSDLPVRLTHYVPGIKEGTLHESLFLIHKSANVLGAAQMHAVNGLPTWSISSAYHANFFLIKAILGLLGVVFVEKYDKTYIFDLWSFDRTTNKTAQDQVANTVIIRTQKNIDHQSIWYIFRRLMRVTKFPVEVIRTDWIKHLKKLDLPEARTRRNKLHYTPSWWYFDDLHKYHMQDGFGELNSVMQTNIKAASKRADYDFALAFILLSLARGLMFTLAQYSKTIAQELELLDNWIAEDVNEYYRISAMPGG